MKCTICDSMMTEALTTFTVVRNRMVYVVENVPCHECLICGHVSFSQDVAKRLEKYSSGKFTADGIYRAWIFNWNIQLRENQPSSTETVPAKLTIPSTAIPASITSLTT